MIIHSTYAANKQSYHFSHQSIQSQCVDPDTLASTDPLLSDPHVHE